MEVTPPLVTGTIAFLYYDAVLVQLFAILAAFLKSSFEYLVSMTFFSSYAIPLALAQPSCYVHFSIFSRFPCL